VCGVLGGKQISGKKGRAMSGFEIGKKQQKHKYEMCVWLCQLHPFGIGHQNQFFCFFPSLN
jgi:hypothetical protein